MAPYDNLPYFRTWLEANIGHTSKSRNDMLILGDFLRYKLVDGVGPEGGNFLLDYKGQRFIVGFALTPVNGNRAIAPNELLVELTDDALNSILAQCAFNEGSVLNEQRRAGQAKPDAESNRTTHRG